MAAQNTTYQRISNYFGAIWASGVFGGLGATLQQKLETGGTFICNQAVAVTVVDGAVTANSAIVITLKTVGGTVGAIPAIQTITPGTGFTIAGTSSDTSVYNYLIIG